MSDLEPRQGQDRLPKKLDGRTAAAKQLAAFTKELVAHVGGAPTRAEMVLIERIAQLQLQLHTFEARAAANGGMSNHDVRSYLAFANSQSRLLRQLGLKGAKPKRESLDDILGGGAP